MGLNSSKNKLDIVANLPPELVLEIISYLSISEVAQCTLVSKHWSNVISHLTPYWVTAASKVTGQSRVTLSRTLSPKQFLIATLKRQDEVMSLNLTPSHIRHSVSMELMFTDCIDAQQQCVIRMQKLAEADNKNEKYELVVDRLVSIQQIPDGICSQSIVRLPLEKQPTVIWACISDNHLHFVTISGLWSSYNLVSRIQISWQLPLLKADQGITITKCKDCSMVILSFWFPYPSNQDHRSTYIMQAVRLGDTLSPPIKLGVAKRVVRKHFHDFFIESNPRYWIRSSFLLSNSKEKIGNVCLSHTLTLQCDSSVMVHAVHSTSVPAAERNSVPKITFTKPCCLNCNYQFRHSTNNVIGHCNSSEINVSSNGAIIGQVLNRRLCVWSNNIKLRESTENHLNIAMISNSPIGGNYMSSCNSVKLVALGTVFSIIAYMDNGYLLDYKLHIVLTHTGQVLSEFSRIERFYNWSLCCQIDPLHKFYFMHDDDSWLSDEQARIPSTPIMTVHNHHGRVHMEALQLKGTVDETWWKHWSYAVNYGLRE